MRFFDRFLFQFHLVRLKDYANKQEEKFYCSFNSI